MIYHLFATISKFLDSLLRVSRDPKCLDTVCEMTMWVLIVHLIKVMSLSIWEFYTICINNDYLVCRNLFLGLSLVEAQTLMGNLTSILVNFPPSRDTVLQILTKLAEKEPRKLLHFASYLMVLIRQASLFCFSVWPIFILYLSFIDVFCII